MDQQIEKQLNELRARLDKIEGTICNSHHSNETSPGLENLDAMALVPKSPVDQIFQTPNISSGRGCSPEAILLHYTAGMTTEGAVSWLMNPDAGASAHFVVGIDGEIVQLAKPDQRAWHAGRSEWGERSDLNSWSVGIEFVNPGPLSDNKITEYGKYWEGRATLIEGSQWAVYTPEQIMAGIKLCKWLIQSDWRITEILRHSDVSPGRKIDPGPAFPYESFVSSVFGRED